MTKIKIMMETDTKHLGPLPGIVRRSKQFDWGYATLVSTTAKEAGSG